MCTHLLQYFGLRETSKPEYQNSPPPSPRWAITQIYRVTRQQLRPIRELVANNFHLPLIPTVVSPLRWHIPPRGLMRKKNPHLITNLSPSPTPFFPLQPALLDYWFHLHNCLFSQLLFQKCSVLWDIQRIIGRDQNSAEHNMGIYRLIPFRGGWYREHILKRKNTNR